MCAHTHTHTHSHKHTHTHDLFSKATTDGTAASLRLPPSYCLRLSSTMFYPGFSLLVLQHADRRSEWEHTPASFKPVMVALISQFPLRSIVALLSWPERWGRRAVTRIATLSFVSLVAFILEVRELTRGFCQLRNTSIPRTCSGSFS